MFWVIIFEPNKIYTYLAPQNDRLNLSFVKDIHTVGDKMARNGPTPATLFFSLISNMYLQ